MQKGKPEVAVFPRAHQDAVIPVKAGIQFFQCNNIINQWISAFTEMTIKVLPEGFRPLLQNRPLLPMQFSGLSLILFRMKWVRTRRPAGQAVDGKSWKNRFKDL
jgi:hypothetical protein